MAVLNLILTLFFCCCSLNQHREDYTKVKGNKYSDILIPHVHFPSKKRISFSVGFVSQLPSVSPVRQQETNVSSVVFPEHCCQILFQLSQKCVWSHVISSSALGTAEVPPKALHRSPNLSPGSGLWLDHSSSEMSGFPQQSMPCTPEFTLSGPCSSGCATVFTSAHWGFILLHQ